MPPPPNSVGDTEDAMLTLPVEPEIPGSYPIQERWYMPFLLQQCEYVRLALLT
jgi:hypothetical protein